MFDEDPPVSMSEKIMNVRIAPDLRNRLLEIYSDKKDLQSFKDSCKSVVETHGFVEYDIFSLSIRNDYAILCLIDTNHDLVLIKEIPEYLAASMMSVIRNNYTLTLH